MAETSIDFNEIADLIGNELPVLYEAWYPIENIVQETNSLVPLTIVQAGIMYYESRDVTHFIAGTGRLYDLKTPMEYEHKVFVYDQPKATWNNVYYGTEKECMAYVIGQQCKLYKFDYSEYMRGKGKLIRFEQKLWEKATGANEHQNRSIQEHIDITMRSVRLKLGLAHDDDLPQLTLDEAVEGTK